MTIIGKVEMPKINLAKKENKIVEEKKVEKLEKKSTKKSILK